MQGDPYFRYVEGTEPNVLKATWDINYSYAALPCEQGPDVTPALVRKVWKALGRKIDGLY